MIKLFNVLAISVYVLLLGLVAYVNVCETMNIVTHLLFTLMFAVIFITGLCAMRNGDLPSNPNKFSQSIK